MKYLLIILFFLIGCSSLFAVNIFPYEITAQKDYPEGRLRKIQFQGGSTFSYYIIPNWAGRNEFIYLKDDKSDDEIRGIRLKFDFIYDIKKYEKNLLLIAKRNDSLYLSYTSPELDIIKSDFIKNISDYKPISIKYIKNSKNIIIDGIFIRFFDENGFKTEIIDKYVISYDIINNSVCYLTDLNGISSLKIKNDTSVTTLKVYDSYENQKIYASGNKILIFASNSISSSTNCTVINPDNHNDTRNFWIESSLDLIEIRHNKIHYIKKSDLSYYLETMDLKGNIINSTYLTEFLYEPLMISNSKAGTDIIFRNAILRIKDEEIQFKADFPVGEYFQDDLDIYQVDNRIILTSDNFSQVFSIEENHFWKTKKNVAILSEYIVPAAIILIIIGLLQLYRHQKRYVSEILELPSIGLVLIIDSNGRLINKNTKAREILKIPYNLKGKKSIEYYFTNDSYKPFLEMIQRSFKTRLDHYKRINIEDEGNAKEWYCRTVILKNITGQFRGLIFTSLDITEQLERKRLSNWASLAHDMQTNLSTIRLNAQQIKTDEGNGQNKKRREKIIHQVNVLFNRVRDIVTVGRDNLIDNRNVNAAEICISARNEFDDLMFPNVNFILDTQNFYLNCDKNKLIRAIRNSIENGIKALKNNKGDITISTYKDSNYAFFKIKDNGTGMDENIRKKMLNPYFTTGGKTGGSGIGTMIMLHVVEMHSGKLEINSKKGEGTEVIFKIPLGRGK